MIRTYSCTTVCTEYDCTIACQATVQPYEHERSLTQVPVSTSQLLSLSLEFNAHKRSGVRELLPDDGRQVRIEVHRASRRINGGQVKRGI